jgi:RNA-binding protein
MLNSKQKKYLKGLGHNVDASLLIGKSGISTNTCEELDRQLAARELVKVKFNEFKEEKKDLAADLALKTDSTLVQIIGNNALFY